MTTTTPAAGTVFPITDDALANTSYLVALGNGAAAAVDPRRDIETYQQLAVDRGLTLTTALETHLHADFVSGSRELADGGVTVVAAAAAGLGFGHRPVEDGDRVSLGDCTVEVLGTAGHTPEHVSFLLHGPGTGPAAVFTGGSLIFGGAARTDLAGADRVDELTRAQWASLQRLAALPGQTRLHPTHGAGSFCSVGPAPAGPGTIAAELAGNDLLTAPDPDTFAQRLLSRLGSFPPYFLELRAVNQHGARRRSELPAPQALPAQAAAAAQASGAVLVDLRPLPQWSVGSPAGAVANMLRPAFASWLGWTVDRRTPLVWLTSTDSAAVEAAEATGLAQRIGHDLVLGWVDGGIDAWREAGLPVQTVDLVDPHTAAAAAADGALLLDVRQRAELASGILPGAVHLELGDIIDGALPPAGRVVTYCGHGERSATAASLLAARGIEVVNLAGGTEAWTDSGRTARAAMTAPAAAPDRPKPPVQLGAWRELAPVRVARRHQRVRRRDGRGRAHRPSAARHRTRST
jgi:glyoxylase-like metal-dependent hydrolase (beta-lactamase superfamily II)/rhodanese-related sulfurtransferase